MSRRDPKLPWRVIGIAVVLFAALAFVGWLILGPDGSDDPGASAAGVDSEPAVPDTATTTQPTVVDSPATAPQIGPTSLDPTSPEALAALSVARAEAGTMDVQLFLIVPGLERLIPVPRTVSAPPTIDAQVRRAVEELINWTGTETISPVAPESRIREVWVSSAGIAYIDFGQSFYDFSGGGSLGELHTVYSIVATLTESFPEIFAVQFLIEGETRETLAGHVDLSRPLLPSEDWVLLEHAEPAGDRADAGANAGV